MSCPTDTKSNAESLMDSFASLLLYYTSPLWPVGLDGEHKRWWISRSEGRSQASSVGAALGISMVSLGWRESSPTETGCFCRTGSQGTKVSVCARCRARCFRSVVSVIVNPKRDRFHLGQRNRGLPLGGMAPKRVELMECLTCVTVGRSFRVMWRVQR